MKTAVIGARGQLGSDIMRTWPAGETRPGGNLREALLEVLDGAPQALAERHTGAVVEQLPRA